MSLDGPWDKLIEKSTSPETALVLKGPAVPVTGDMSGPVTAHHTSLLATPKRLALISLVTGRETERE
jgi:hypothetical protein